MNYITNVIIESANGKAQMFAPKNLQAGVRVAILEGTRCSKIKATPRDWDNGIDINTDELLVVGTPLPSDVADLNLQVPTEGDIGDQVWVLAQRLAAYLGCRQQANVVVVPQGGKVELWTLEPVSAGEALRLCYGASYWLAKALRADPTNLQLRILEGVYVDVNQRALTRVKDNLVDLTERFASVAAIAEAVDVIVAVTLQHYGQAGIRLYVKRVDPKVTGPVRF